MLKTFLVCLVITVCVVQGYPKEFLTKEFKIGIEYDHSLPMSAGSHRFRHRNNYDPFFITIAATAKNGYVLAYLEVKATTDIFGEVDFRLIQGRTGSKSMVFQLSSNHSDFLSYSYRAYGITEMEYNKIQNIIVLPMPVTAGSTRIIITQYLIILFILPLITIVFTH